MFFGIRTGPGGHSQPGSLRRADLDSEGQGERADVHTYRSRTFKPVRPQRKMKPHGKVSRRSDSWGVRCKLHATPILANK